MACHHCQVCCRNFQVGWRNLQVDRHLSRALETRHTAMPEAQKPSSNPVANCRVLREVPNWDAPLHALPPCVHVGAQCNIAAPSVTSCEDADPPRQGVAWP